MQDSNNLSHAHEPESLGQVVAECQHQLHQHPLLTPKQKEECLNYLQQLAESSLGQFLLLNKGLNGYWTNYLVFDAKAQDTNHEGNPLSDIEQFLTQQAPTALATQERGEIFLQHIQQQLRDGIQIASIPCGLMGEILNCNFSNLEGFHITGIDIDPLSLQQAKQCAKNQGLAEYCQFIEKNALELNHIETYDIISSNGLNIYINDDATRTKLYQRFFDALKPGGQLITSTLTPLPSQGKCEWAMDQINAEHLLKQAIIFGDIIGLKWQNFRGSEESKNDLLSVGFKKVDIIFDTAKIMPTLIASK